MEEMVESDSQPVRISGKFGEEGKEADLKEDVVEPRRVVLIRTFEVCLEA